MGDMAKWHFAFELGVPFTPVQQLMAVMPPRRCVRADAGSVPILHLSLSRVAAVRGDVRTSAAITRCHRCAAL